MSDETIGQLYDRALATGPVRWGPLLLTAIEPPERREEATHGPDLPIYEPLCDNCGARRCSCPRWLRDQNDVTEYEPPDIWIDLGSQR